MIDLHEYPITEFPDDFLMGVASAGQQIEGNNCSWHDDPKYYGTQNYTGVPWVPAGIAMDSYHRYEEDIALAKEMHLDAFRLSVEWSRIEQEPGVFLKRDHALCSSFKTIERRRNEDDRDTASCVASSMVS